MTWMPVSKKRGLSATVAFLLVLLWVSAEGVSARAFSADAGTVGGIASLIGAVSGGVALLWLARYPLLRFHYGIVTRGMSDFDEPFLDGWDPCPAGAGMGGRRNLLSLPPAMLDLTVTKFPGRHRPVKDCVLPLDALRDVLPGAGEKGIISLKKQARANWGREMTFYDYTVTPGGKDATVLVFEDGGRMVGVILEMEDGLVRYLAGLAK